MIGSNAGFLALADVAVTVTVRIEVSFQGNKNGGFRQTLAFGLTGHL